jgi:hypothetical protein
LLPFEKLSGVRALGLERDMTVVLREDQYELRDLAEGLLEEGGVKVILKEG